MDIYDALLKHKQNGESCMMVTVVEKHGEGPVEVGKKMLVTESDEAYGTVGGGALEYAARELCKTLMDAHESTLKKYLLNEGKIIEDAETLPMACGGTATLFFEYIGVKGHVYIFGAGHVGQALTNILKTMPYHITVIDDRPEVIQVFHGADETYCMAFTDYIEAHSIKQGSYVIVCTPSHKYDYNVIHKVLELSLKPKYIGMLCSITKLKDYLSKTIDAFGEDVDLSNFYSPIGLDTGGGSPAEIAISIAAEMLTIEYNKHGAKHMRGKY
ncbi:MAG: XdhC/CoxI family protein [Vallitaleaceae bacterium]|jgi:xanthine dehydrogenase accessory factor|nr:XdhC/CoxI family protein [Vallitaleaceae bacterium]